jgi:arabinogalactan oligomer/maltooligosaccharide transport system permease protein
MKLFKSSILLTLVLLFVGGGASYAFMEEPQETTSPFVYLFIIAGLAVAYICTQMFLGKRLSNQIRVITSYALLVLLVIISIYPILFIIMTSLKVENALFSPTFLPLDENGNWNATFSHYTNLFSGYNDQFVGWFWNTFKISALSMIFGTILTILASYALSRFKFNGRQSSLTLLLILGMFPGFMAMIAIYIFLQELQLHDTHLALILVYSLGAPLGGVFVAKGFYDTIPKSLEEAARIDGASQLGIFIRIVLPLSKPMLTFIALTIFTGTWVDFIFAKIIIFSDEKMTLAVGLLTFVRDMNETDYNAFAAGSVIAAIPITLLFIFLQRFLVEGLTAGASKG